MSILDLSFNCDTTCLVAGHNTGFIIYSLKPSLDKHFSTDLNGGIGKARLLRSTNILGLVGGGEEPFRAKDTVIIWNQHKKSKLLGIEYHEPVKNLYVTNKKIIIILESRICIAALNNGDTINVKETYNNEKGICKYSCKNDSIVIVTLGVKKGEVAVWSLTSDKHSSISAHENNIIALAINDDGTMIATASESGTNIHIYNTESGNMLYKLRRGTSTAEIYDMCFDKDSKQLACVSNKGTVHIWDLQKTTDETTANQKSVLSSIGSVITYFDSVWSREKISIGDMSKMICSFDSEDILHIATYEGNYFRISGKDGKYDQVKRSSLYVNQK